MTSATCRGCPVSRCRSRPTEKVERLVGPAELDVGSDHDRIVALHQRIEQLVDADRAPPRGSAAESRLARACARPSSETPAGRRPRATGARTTRVLPPHLGARALEYLEDLLLVRARRSPRPPRRSSAWPGRGAPARVSDQGREVTDDEHGLVPEVLELSELRERDGVAEVDVRRRRVHAELHPQRTPRLQLRYELRFGDDMATPREMIASCSGAAVAARNPSPRREARHVTAPPARAGVGSRWHVRSPRRRRPTHPGRAPARSPPRSAPASASETARSTRSRRTPRIESSGPHMPASVRYAVPPGRMASSAVWTWVWLPRTAETRPSRNRPMPTFSDVASPCMSTKITLRLRAHLVDHLGGSPKGTVGRIHEHTPDQIEHADRRPALARSDGPTNLDPGLPAGSSAGAADARSPACTATIAAVLPDVVPRGQDVDAGIVQLLGASRIDALAARRVLAVGDDEIDPLAPRSGAGASARPRAVRDVRRRLRGRESACVSGRGRWPASPGSR